MTSTNLNLPNRLSPSSRHLDEDQASFKKDSLKQDGSAQNEAWSRLCVSLESLQTITGFPSLSSAVGLLLSYLNRLAVEMESQHDSEDLATELATLSQSLKQHLDGASPILESECATSITMNIESQVTIMKEIIDNAPEEGIVDRAVLMERCRRVQQLFQRLLMNLRMSSWSVTNEHLANTKLDGLHPAKQAAFDSSLSTEINRRSCTEGTRIGVLAGLDDWLCDQASPSIYWINGMAGTGKTTIASTFCERVERRKLLAASFFCTRSSAECRNVSRIIPTIAYQVARYSMPYQAALCEVLEQTPDIMSQTLSKQFEQLLTNPLQRVKDALPDHLLVVIDALDECNDRNGVELLLNVLFRYASQIPLRFLVTSRPEPEIYTKMSQYSHSRNVLHLHDLEKSLVQGDIELYLTKELEFVSLDPAHIQTLADRSGILFIYAATLVRYILPAKKSVDPHKRLRSLLSMSPQATKQHTHIDALYTAVLNSALSEDQLDAEAVGSANVVLGTVLNAQEPINVEAIAKLSQIEDPQRVEHILHVLGSVLHRSEVTGLVSTLHASFPDFMFNKQRSGDYFCDISKHSHWLAQGCFLVMEEQLRFNICDLQSSFVPDHQVDDIQERINQRISQALVYACRYWGSHLGLASRSDDLLKMLEDFICNRLLFWMEVMNLKRETVAGIEVLFKAKHWLDQAGHELPDLTIALGDARNFVTTFAGSPASQSTPHIYISSLAFCPRSSSVYKNYWKRTRGLLELKGSLMDRREGAAISTWNIGSEVHSVAYSPDGSRVAVGCEDRTVKILNAYDGTPYIDPLQGHTGPVQSVAFSPDGRFIASGSSDRSIRVWNAYNGSPCAGPLVGHTAIVYAVAFSSDSMHVASGSMDRTIRVWNARDGTLLLGPLEGHSDIIESVAFSPGDVLIASASYDQTIRLWNAHSGTPATPPLKGHTDYVKSIAFTPDGTRLVSGSYDRTIRIWSLSNNSPVASPFEGNPSGIQSVAISSDGTQVACGLWDSTVRVCRIDDGALVAGPFVGHTCEVTSVKYSPDGTRLISASSDGIIQVWNVRGGLVSLPAPFRPHLTGISSVSVFGQRRIVSFDHSHGMWIWDLTTEGVIRSPVNGLLTSPGLKPPLPTGSSIVVKAEDSSLYVMNMADGSFIAGPYYGHTGSLTSFGFSADGALFATGADDGTIRIWKPPQSKPIAGPFHAHNGAVTSVALSLDNSRLVSCSDRDKTVRVWNVRNGVMSAMSPTESYKHASMTSPSALIYEGWKHESNGWVMNDDSRLLLWIPNDIARVSLFPNVEYIITEDGIIHVTDWELLLGDRWSECYVPG